MLVADLINCKTFMTDTNIGQKPLLWYSAHLNFDIKRHFYVNTLFQLISLSTFVKRYIGKRPFPCHISISFSLKHTSWNVLVKWGFPVSKKCLVLLIDNLTGSKLKLNFLHILLFYVVSILKMSYSPFWGWPSSTPASILMEPGLIYSIHGGHPIKASMEDPVNMACQQQRRVNWGLKIHHSDILPCDTQDCLFEVWNWLKWGNVHCLCLYITWTWI